MNQQIQELIKEATSTTFNQDGEGFHHFSKEKFAKLIIKECLSLSKKNADILEPTMPEAAYGIFSNNVSIRTHFGVEE